MPTVRLQRVRSVKSYDRYNSKDRGTDLLATGPEGLDDHMAQAIQDEHARFPRKNEVKTFAYTIYQSWHPKESALCSLEEYNEMGKQLAERFAPGHLAWVVTHTDKAHTHNHIVICSVHSETGKMLDPRRKDIQRLHGINNEIAKERGFSLNLPRVKDHLAKLSGEVRKLVANGKNSWVLDMVEKIDFARASSTSFDEYVGQLKTLGVDARVENKNITYIYGGKKSEKIRGKSLGALFDKDGLMKTFRENDEKFAKQPGLREQIRSDIRAAFDGKGNPVGAPSDLLLESRSHRGLREKDYGQFTKVPRGRDRADLPAIFDERAGPLYREMKRAQEVGILDYCAKHKIQTKLNEKGETVLKGREFVVLTASEWVNTKNRTKGTIIDFVAAHDETTYLRAVAKLTGNKRLLLLEQVMGEYKKGYQSFHVPKPKAAPAEKRAQAVAKLFQSRGIPHETTKEFLRSKNPHVGEDASVWMMNEKGDAAMEFREESSGNWKAKRHGNLAAVFFERTGKSKSLMLFRDPFEFALFRGQTMNPKHKDVSVLVMMGEGGSDRRINEFLALHTHITEVHLAQAAKTQDRLAFHEVKRRLDPFQIEVKPLEVGALGKERGRGPDIGM